MQIHVRPATPLDAETVASLHLAAWQVGYRGILDDEVLDGGRKPCGVRGITSPSVRYRPQRGVAIRAQTVLLVLLLLLTAGGCAHRTAPAVDPGNDDRPDLGPAVQALAQELLDADYATGLAVGVVRDGRVETWGFGRVGPGEDATAPDASTVFEIGSVTKVFTAITLAAAVEQEGLDLDAPVSSLLGGAAVPSSDGIDITLRHLATHRSGLPRMPDNFSPAGPEDPFADYGEEELLSFLADHAIGTTPGSQYAYSNVGAGLLGHALASHAGRAYADLLSEGIFAPLGLSSTRVGPPPEGAGSAQGHDDAGLAVPFWTFDALEGAGAISSTVTDLLVFVEANLDPPDAPLGRALQASHVEQITPGGARMGLGWHLGLGGAADDPLRWHNGQTGGFHTYVAFDPDAHFGLVVLSNRATRAIDKLGLALVLLLRGESATLEFRPVAEVSVEALERCVGEYAVTPDFSLTVSRQGSMLFVQATGQARYRVWPESEGRFRYRIVDATLEFQLDDDGPAAGVVLHQGGQDVPGERVSKAR